MPITCPTFLILNVSNNMKRATLLLFTILILGKMSFGQGEITQTEKLVATAKVWGFLKYYHPRVADGEFNWDEQLIEVLPKVRVTTDKKEFSNIILKWIESLGSVRISDKIESNLEVEYFDKNFNLNWFNNTKLFTQEVSEKLKYIEKNRHQGNQYYISKNKGGTLSITNELKHNNFNWEDENIRLLALFRYWNIIQYFFPYKYQTDVNWDVVLKKMLPTFLNCESKTEFHLALLELTVSIDDSHTSLMTKEIRNYIGTKFLPVEINIIEDQAVITKIKNDSLAKLNDLRIGDIILKLNNKPIEQLFNEKSKYISGSNINRKQIYLTEFIFSGNSDTCNFIFSRNGEVFSKKIVRYNYSSIKKLQKNKEAESFRIIESNIGYVNMGQLELAHISQMMKSFKNTKGIIIDLREYPNQTGYELSKYFTSENREFKKMLYPDINYPGRFISSNSQVGQSRKLKYKGEMVILVNEYTQSQGEHTAMILQKSDNATTIGSQTSGADGTVLKFDILGGFRTKITGLGVFYEDNTETQRKGIKIDIIAKPTINGIINGIDEVLKRAIEHINE
jgi:carboxyl-terminal processing protease